MDDDKPGKNASRDDWEEYALANGKTADELDGLKRDEIVALFPDDDDADNAQPTPEDAAEAAYEAGEAMTAPDAPAAVRAGAEDVPPHLRAGAVHRAIKAK